MIKYYTTCNKTDKGYFTMGRRTFISISQINRWISASNRREKEKQNEALIRAQGGTRREMPPEISLEQVDFDRNSRIARILFKETQAFRTIKKYVTRNYVRYPIFSDWKTKCKSIPKTIKLTNEKLENLLYEDDPLIKMFSKDIVAALNDETLYPSWFVKKYLDEEYKEKIAEIERNFLEFQKEKKSTILVHTQNIKDIKAKIGCNNVIINKYQPKLKRINTKITKIESVKITALNAIFSLGIYPLINSNKRKAHLTKKRNQIENLIAGYQKINKSYSEEVEKEKNIVNSICKELSNKESAAEDEKKQARKTLEELSAEITPLPVYAESDIFFPLKDFFGFEYKKTIGCYIIRNKENKKCYVGQSKDVYKRIKQHFKGTVPNNIIFAEDYYSSYDNDNLFELLIVPCTTKDELDATERRLIAEYEARTKGYNGTSGNT